MYTRRLKSTHSDSWRLPEGRSATGSSSAPFSAEAVSAAVTAHLLTFAVPGKNLQTPLENHGAVLPTTKRATANSAGLSQPRFKKKSPSLLRAFASVPLPVLLLPFSSPSMSLRETKRSVRALSALISPCSGEIPFRASRRHAGFPR